MVQFMQFPVLNVGLDHYGSRSFICWATRRLSEKKNWRVKISRWLSFVRLSLTICLGWMSKGSSERTPSCGLRRTRTSGPSPARSSPDAPSAVFPDSRNTEPSRLSRLSRGRGAAPLVFSLGNGSPMYETRSTSWSSSRRMLNVRQSTCSSVCVGQGGCGLWSGWAWLTVTTGKYKCGSPCVCVVLFRCIKSRSHHCIQSAVYLNFH